MKLYRCILPVFDIEKAVVFYSTVLGNDGRRVSPGRHYFNLEGTILACYDPKADGDDIESWSFHTNQYLYIAVPDLQKTMNKVLTFDIEEVGEIITQPWGETLLYTKDPFGNPICFVDEKTVFLG